MRRRQLEVRWSDMIDLCCLLENKYFDTSSSQFICSVSVSADSVFTLLCCLHSPAFLLLSLLTLGAHTVQVWYARRNLPQQFTRLCCLPQPSEFVLLSADSKDLGGCTLVL